MITPTIVDGDNFTFNLKLKKALADSTTPINLDLGLPALQFDIGSNLKLKTQVGYDFALKFGLNSGSFNVDTLAADELKVNFDVKADSLNANAKLGLLKLNVKDAVDTPTQLSGGLAIDLQGSLSSLNLISSSIGGLNKNVNINLDLSTTFGSDFPSFKTRLAIDWGLNPDFSVKQFDVGFKNTRIGLDSLTNSFIKPIGNKINEVLKPIQPVIDILNTKIPVIDVRVIDLLGSSASSVNSFLDIYNALNTFSTIAATGEITLINDLKLNDFIGGSLLNLSAATLKTANVGALTGSNNLPAAFQSLASLGVKLPILTDPKQFFRLLIGDDTADLFSLDLNLPTFTTGASKSVQIWVVPPVFANIAGDISLGINLGFGYDAKGLTRLSEGTGVILDGFYLKDTSGLSLGMGVEASGGLGTDNPVFTAALAIGARLQADVQTKLQDIKDIDGKIDGKLRSYEIKQRFDQGPLCLFSLDGKVSIGIFGEGKVGLGPFKKSIRKTLVDKDLLNFDTDECGGGNPLLPELATPVGDVLRLNMGRFAGDRNFGSKKDENEVFKVEHISGIAGNETVRVSAFGFSRDYAGVREIYAEGGQGNDTIELAPGVLAESKLWGDFNPTNPYSGPAASGPDGDDRLYAGNGRTELHGGGGNDYLTAEDAPGLVRTGSAFLYGDDGDDELEAGGSDDFLYGGAGSDVLYGNDGQDQLYGDRRSETSTDLSGIDPNNANDVLDGGSGNDLLYGELGEDFLDGKDGNDILFGDQGQFVSLTGGSYRYESIVPTIGSRDELHGGRGDDVIVGGGGDDNRVSGINLDGSVSEFGGLFGEANNDTIVGDNARITFNAANQVEKVETLFPGQGGSDLINAGSGSDRVLGGEGNDTLFGGDDSDTILGDDGQIDAIGTVTLLSGNGNDTIFGGDDRDFIYGQGGNDIIFGDSGQITLPATGTEEIVSTNPGNGGNDFIQGNDGDDIIVAGAGNDTEVTGNAGRDIILGDNGKVTRVNSVVTIETINPEVGGDDKLTGNADADIIIGGSGNDVLTNETNDPDILFGDNATVVRQAGITEITSTFPTFNSAIGGRDTITGSNLRDVIVGGSGGSDRSGIGGDIIKGNGGDDLIFGDNAFIRRNDTTNQIEAAEVRFVDNGGDDTIAGGAGNDTVYGEGGNDIIEGNEDSDTIYGQGGNDRIVGGSFTAGIADGTDYIRGGTGNDLIGGDNASIDLAAQTVTFFNDGMGGADFIFGEDGSVTLMAGRVSSAASDPASGTGDDTIAGGVGDDVIFGGAGSDRINGNAGSDRLWGDNGIITFTGSDTVLETIEASNDGSDTITDLENASYVLGGSGLIDRITTGASADFIVGDYGRISLTNGDLRQIETTVPTAGGTDIIYSGNGADIVLAGTGDDTIDGGLDNANDILLGDNGIVYGAADPTFANDITSTNPGNGGRDTITGGGGQDIIIGGSGSGEITGGLVGKGGDILKGEGGDDIILGDNGYITRDSNNVVEQIETSFFNTASGQKEFSDQGGDDLIEDGQDNTIALGGNGNDTITTGSGIDLLVGDHGRLRFKDGILQRIETTHPTSGGNDTIDAGDGADIALGGTGNDTIAGGNDSAVDILLGDNGVVVRADGSAQANDIFSTNPTWGGQDSITGGGGNDIIVGGSGGRDIAGIGGDRLFGNAGNDVVIGDNAYITRNTAEIIENIKTTEPSIGGDDSIAGNDGDDILLGGFGDDTIAGNAGNDIILGDNGLLNYKVIGNVATLELLTTTDPTMGGNDTIQGNDDDDIAIGGAAADTINGGAGEDILIGDNGQVILTTNGIRLIETIAPGIGGSDTITGNQGNDIILGGFANDLLQGDEGNDIILGDNGKLDYAFEGDAVVGSDSNLSTLDFITTTDPTLGGNDEIYGGLGDDQILGGTGADVLFGDGEDPDSSWVLAGRGDFNGDGKQDILWRSPTDDRTLIWLMDGVNVLNRRLLPGVPFDWSVAAIADFNGDGKSDLFWRNTAGANAVWLFDGTKLLDAAFLPSVSSDWTAQLGDFNGDGKADLFWRNPSGATAVWLLNGTKILDAAFLPSVSSDWTVQLGDFNGDGKTDLFWRNPSGATAVWLLNGAKILDAAFLPSLSPDWTTQLGDFNGDGKTDLFWRNTAGANAVWLFDGTKILDAAFLPSVSSDWTAQLGDFNGDSKTDLFWRNPSGATAVWLLNGTKILNAAFLPYSVPPEWTAIVGDFDGDKKSDLFWRNTSGATAVWLFDSTTLKSAAIIPTDGSANDLLLGDHGKIYTALPSDRNYFSIDIGLADGAGNDTIHGNQGDDIILGQQGDDNLFGDAGEDDMMGGHNVMGGADGNDTMDGGANADVMLGDNGTITRRSAQSGGWQRYPAPFADVIRDVVRFDDRDRIGGNDIMRGGSGDDIIQGQRGNDNLSGDAGDDEMYGQLGDDVMQGGDGQDFMLGDVGIITREYNLDGTPRRDRNGSWKRNALLTDVASLTASLNNDAIASSVSQTAEVLLLTGTSQTQVLSLFADGNDTMSGGNGDDVMLGQRGDDQMSGDTGNDYLEGNSGNDSMNGGDGDDFIIGDNTNNVSSFNTEVPTITHGFHIIEQNPNLNFAISDFGIIVTPSVTLTSKPNTGLLPTFTLLPQSVRDHSPTPQIGSLTRNGVSLKALIAIVPNLNNHLNLLEGNDRISGGAGKDTIVGDNYQSFMPLRTGNLDVDRNLDQLTTAFHHLEYDLHDLEVALSNGQPARTLSMGNDVIDGGDDRDLVMGDNGTLYSPLVVQSPSNIAAINSFTNDLKQAIASFNRGVTKLLDSFTGSINSPYTLSAGNDTISGGNGNDKLLGDDTLIFAPLLNSFSYQRGSFWNYGFDRTPKAVRPNFRDFDLSLNNDTLNGGNGDDLMLGGYSNLIIPLVTRRPMSESDRTQLRLGLNTLVSDVEGFLRDLHNEQYGIDYVNRNQSNTLIAENDQLNGENGADLMSGDNATLILPMINGQLDLTIDFRDGNLDTSIDSYNFMHTLPHQYDFIYRNPSKGLTQFGEDVLFGGNDNDVLFGVKWRDRLLGNAGDDKLFGGKESDLLDGGAGINVVRSTNPSPSDRLSLVPVINANLQDLPSPVLQQALLEIVAAKDNLALEGDFYGNFS